MTSRPRSGVLEPDPANDSPAAPRSETRTTPSDRDDLCCTSDIHILVLDDESVCRVIQSGLGQFAPCVDTVSDPARMKAQLRSRPYHVIILDHVIPGLQSEQILEWVRESQAEASIIVVTAYPSVDCALNCERVGTSGFLTKPFQVCNLKGIVERCLKNKGLLRLSEVALRESLGKAIRDRRKFMHLTLAQMAERTKVSLGYLSQIELGKNSASIDTLYRICLGLGIKMSDLFQNV